MGAIRHHQRIFKLAICWLPKTSCGPQRKQDKGGQVYGCVEGNWMLIGPDARLINEQGNVIGRHFAGPTWQMKDGESGEGLRQMSFVQASIEAFSAGEAFDLVIGRYI